MNEHSGLTEFKRETTDGEKMLDAVMASLFVLSVIWALFLMDEYLGYNLKPFGMRPRSIDGIKGVFTMHFLHGDWKHLINNTLSFFVLNSFLFYFYRSLSLKVFGWLFLFSGIVLWFIGRPANHIGASMLIYGLFGFLLFSGLLRKNPRARRVALAVSLYYGSMMWYAFPIEAGISWEGHLSGLTVGAVLALVYRKQGPPEPTYRFESEPEPDDSDPYWMPGYQPPAADDKSGEPLNR